MGCGLFVIFGLIILDLDECLGQFALLSTLYWILDKYEIKNILGKSFNKDNLNKIVGEEIIENAYGSKLPTITSTISGTYTQAESQTATSTTTPETFTDKYKLSITQNLFDAGYNDLEIERSKILFDNEVINFKILIQINYLKSKLRHFKFLSNL